jgi:MscS family membrane protein
MELLETTIPNPYLQALALVVAAAVLGKLADWVLQRVLLGWAARSHSRIDDNLIGLLHGPVVKTVVLGGLLLAYERVDTDPMRDELLERVLHTVVLGLWTLFALRASALLLRSASDKPGLDLIQTRTFPVFDNVAKTLITAVAIWGVITIWKIPAMPWLASAGVAGIAIGFAAKDTLANFISGIFIIADAPYRVGDYVNLDNGQRGMVTRIGLRSTRILTRDDVEITIPNAIIGNAPIINESAGPSTAHRIRTRVSVAYGTELEPMRELLLKIAIEHPDICDEPVPRVRFRDFGDSGLNHDLLCWIPRPELRGAVIDALNTRIHDDFARAHIEIPFPKRDLYLKQMPPLTPG